MRFINRGVKGILSRITKYPKPETLNLKPKA